MLAYCINMRRYRLDRGMSQQELADMTGYKSRSSINKIEKGLTMVTLEQAQKVDTPDVSFEVKRAVVETMISKITVNSSSEKGVFITIYFRFGDKKGGYLCTQFAVRKIIYT